MDDVVVESLSDHDIATGLHLSDERIGLRCERMLGSRRA